MQLNLPLAECDSELANLISEERSRQRKSIVLIASENFCGRSTLEAVGSILANKYSEGYPGARYYAGNKYIDQIERLCQRRALDAFKLDPEMWGVNVQPLSGSPANFQVYSALLPVGARIMSLDLPHGGHLSHGYQTPKKKISYVSQLWEVLPYRLNESTGIVDMDDLEKLAMRYYPKLIVAGTSSYSRVLDYKRFRAISQSVGDCILMSDMAHIAGLVAAGLHPSPFDYSDIVTTTTHKTLRGPRGALIFYRKGPKPVASTVSTTTSSAASPIQPKYDFEEKINAAVFPGLQGGPHMHTIAGIATCLKQAASPSFVEYQKQVLLNCKVLAKTLVDGGVDIITGGTDNHLCVVDLRRMKLTGNLVEAVCENVGIILNKNTIPGDRSAMNPSGIRVGSPAMTSRGAIEKDFQQIGSLLGEAIRLTREIVDEAGCRTSADIAKYLSAANSKRADLDTLRSRVEGFAGKLDYFPN